ncbi:NADH dehydrogenase subunit J [Perilla frutescens var. frutescens]|nr:NADH dehydrogenase subunit J [Perilla frutescens var. frutescens]
MAPSLVRLYEQMPKPKYVIAMGACTITGRMFSNYSTIRGVDKLIPVDVYLPGRPPKSEAVIDAITKLRIETLQIKPEDWHSIAVILYVYGYDYLRFHCAYDVAHGGLLATVYHFTRIEYDVDQSREVCIKVFASRRNPRIPSVFWAWKSTDFQE